MPKEGQAWPLQLVFLVLLILAILVLVDPTLLNKTAPPTFGQGLLLLGLAAAAAFVLYVPLLRDWYKGRGTADKILQRLDEQSVVLDGLAAAVDVTKSGSVAERLHQVQTNTAAIVGDTSTALPQQLAKLAEDLDVVAGKVDQGVAKPPQQ